MTAVVGGVVGAVVALGIAGLVWGLTRNSNPSNGAVATTTTTTSSTSTTGAKLTGEAKRLETLLTDGNKVTYHATYRLTSTDPSAGGGVVAIEVWRRPRWRAARTRTRSRLSCRPDSSTARRWGPVGGHALLWGMRNRRARTP
jgi:hypothetical protein